jgi:hypothetical protein
MAHLRCLPSRAVSTVVRRPARGNGKPLGVFRSRIGNPMERGRFLATEYKEQPDQDKGVLSSKSHAEAGDP